MVLDSQRNLIVSGSSRNDQGNADYQTAKYAANGSNFWTRRFDSGGADAVRGLALDREGDVLITGTSRTVKYATDGTELWSAAYGGRSVAVDASNNVVITGFSEADFTTVKLTPHGSNVWLRAYDKIGRPDISQAVTTDPNGNVYIGGLETFFRDREGDHHRWWLIKYDSSGTVEWGTNFGLARYSDLLTQIKGFQIDAENNVIFCANEFAGTGDPFHVAKISAFGETLWNRVPPAAVTSESGAAAAVLDHQGCVYITGSDSIVYPSHFGYLTLKLDNSTGNTLWRTNYAGPGAGYHRGNAICVDSAGSAFVTGQSQSAPDQPSDWATIKYDSLGRELWVVRYDGPVHGEDQATAIAVDNAGGIYVGGFTTTTNGIEMLVIKYVEMQTIQVLDDRTVKLQFLGTPGLSYRFQVSTNLTAWEDLGSSTADPSGLYQWLDTNPAVGSARFYRTLPP